MYRAFQAQSVTDVEEVRKEKWTPAMAKGKHSLRHLFLRFIDPNSKATPQAHKNRRGRCSHALERAVELGLLDPYYFDKTLQDFSSKEELILYLEALYNIIEKVKGPQGGKHPFTGPKSLEEFRLFIEAIERLCPMMAYLSVGESIKEMTKLLKDKKYWFKHELSIKVKTARCPLPELEESEEPEAEEKIVLPHTPTESKTPCPDCNEVVCACADVPAEKKPEVYEPTNIDALVKEAIEALYKKMARFAERQDDEGVRNCQGNIEGLRKELGREEIRMRMISNLESQLKEQKESLALFRARVGKVVSAAKVYAEAD